MSREEIATTFFDQGSDLKDNASATAMRDREIYDCWGSGDRVTDLAERYDITKNTITQIVNRVESELSRRFMEAHMAMRVRNTRRFEQVYFRAVRAFEESSNAATTEVVSETKGNENRTVTTKTSSGDPRYLKEAREALEAVQRLWGLNAPERVQKEVSYHVDNVADDTLIDRVNKFKAVRDRLTVGLASVEEE